MGNVGLISYDAHTQCQIELTMRVYNFYILDNSTCEINQFSNLIQSKENWFNLVSPQSNTYTYKNSISVRLPGQQPQHAFLHYGLKKQDKTTELYRFDRAWLAGSPYFQSLSNFYSTRESGILTISAAFR